MNKDIENIAEQITNIRRKLNEIVKELDDKDITYRYTCCRDELDRLKNLLIAKSLKIGDYIQFNELEGFVVGKTEDSKTLLCLTKKNTDFPTLHFDPYNAVEVNVNEIKILKATGYHVDFNEYGYIKEKDV